MTLRLWGGKERDPAAVRAKQEDIKNKNNQFNLMIYPLNEKYKGEFKEEDVVTEQLLDDQSSTGNNEKMMNYHKRADISNSISEGNSLKYHVSKKGFSSPKKYNHNFQEILTKKSYFLKEDKISKDNNVINKNSNKFINIKFDEEDPDYQGIHEVNAGTNKYIFTKPVTKADPTMLKLLNDSNKTTSFGTVNDDKVLNVVKDTTENSNDNNIKGAYATTAKNEFSKEVVKRTSSSDSTSFDKDKTVKESDTEKQNKKLDDFMGPFVEGNTPRDIYDQNSWQKWFNGFLPKEEAVGHNYQQELLSKMFPKNNFQPDVQTQEPRLISAQKSKIPSESHDQPSESHDHGNDYAPLDIDPLPWQSYTPVYNNKHQPKHHSEQFHERIPSYHKQNRPQQNPRKERYSHVLCLVCCKFQWKIQTCVEKE